MDFYRVEQRHTRVGPYNHNCTDDGPRWWSYWKSVTAPPEVGEGYSGWLAAHPNPHADAFTHADMEFFALRTAQCGFATPRQLIEWFGHLLPKLEGADFVVSLYDVNDRRDGGRQSIAEIRLLDPKVRWNPTAFGVYASALV